MNTRFAASSAIDFLTRRNFFKYTAAAAFVAAAGLIFSKFFRERQSQAAAYIASVNGYEADIVPSILRGLQALGITSEQVKAKRVLLKPNLVEPHSGVSHINTHPLVIRAAAEAFRYLGAAHVAVAEGAGHRRDSLLVLEESGLADVLFEDKIPFVDLNSGPVTRIKNLGARSKLGDLILPKALVSADLVVSLAKMKTHHWAGITLAMKNLFGVMPGMAYGWPKNVLHWAGITESILDITATVKPGLAIVDGIVGMEGDGPIMGRPVQVNVLVMGRNLPAVDATCARIMGINPRKIPYLKHASGWLGPIREFSIEQRGERIASVRRNFELLDSIPSHRKIRLAR
jgi:uncharacterized protein (DUF362 family)